MSKISALDFAKNVEQNRQSLISHCRENGKSVSDTASLSDVVAANNTIETGTAEGTCKVEFRNIDGELVVPIQYVNVGESATVPSTNPSFDSDYLEFDSWATSASDSLSNVQRDILAMPQYKTKLDTNLNQRPTYLFCYFYANTSPTLQIGSLHTNTYINWGDGSAVEQITSTTISHTYTADGLYVIMIYGDAYSLGGNNNGGVFSNNSYRTSLLKLYLGENCKPQGSQYFANQCFSLQYVVLNNYFNFVTSTFENDYSLKSIIIPSNITTIGARAFSECHNLKYVILPNGITSIGQTAFQTNRVLESITMPNTVVTIGESLFTNSYTLKNVTISNMCTTIPNFYYCYNLENILIPTSVTSIGASALNGCGFKSLTIPSNVISIDVNALNSLNSLANLVLYSNFDISLSLIYNNFTDECLIDIANKLKDNTGLNSKTITFSTYKQTIMRTIYLDSNGDQVPYGTTGAVSLLEFIQNKNWTVSFG